MRVRLVEITQKNLHAVLALQVAPEQQDLVAPVAYSIAEAHFEPQAWFRAIYAGRKPVGFVMLQEEPHSHYVWRMMIDAASQGRGYGAAAMRLVIDRARNTPGVDSVWLSYADREGNAAPFYRSLGFRETGDVEDAEVLMRLDLEPSE